MAGRRAANRLSAELRSQLQMTPIKDVRAGSIPDIAAPSTPTRVTSNPASTFTAEPSGDVNMVDAEYVPRRGKPSDALWAVLDRTWGEYMRRTNVNAPQEKVSIVEPPFRARNPAGQKRKFVIEPREEAQKKSKRQKTGDDSETMLPTPFEDPPILMEDLAHVEDPIPMGFPNPMEYPVLMEGPVLMGDPVPTDDPFLMDDFVPMRNVEEEHISTGFDWQPWLDIYGDFDTAFLMILQADEEEWERQQNSLQETMDVEMGD